MPSINSKLFMNTILNYCDNKCRITLPQNYIKLIEVSGKNELIIIPCENTKIIAYNYAEWKKIESNIINENDGLYNFSKQHITKSIVIKVTKKGIIKISKKFIETVGILTNTKVVIIGMGKYFEIWNYKNYLKEIQKYFELFNDNILT